MYISKSCWGKKDWELGGKKEDKSFRDFKICTHMYLHLHTNHVKHLPSIFKGRLKQTKPDAPIIGASESLTHRLVNAVNYSRTVFNSPCSSNLSHTCTEAHTHTRRLKHTHI